VKVHLRAPTEQDWPAILRAANASLPWDPDGNQPWLENRRNFDEAAFQRRHYVATDDGSNEIVGYGSIEGGSTPGRYRVFVVMDARLLTSVGDVLYQRLHEDFRSLGGEVAWVREEARDIDALKFFRRHGFANEQPFTTEQGLPVVILEHGYERTGQTVE
jgi:hypothetical protein